MSDTAPIRRNLLAGLDKLKPQAPPVDDAAIAAVAEKHGFAQPAEPVTPPPAVTPTLAPAPTNVTPIATADDEDGQQIVMRRRRKLRGRTQQFNVRLRPDTVDIIYAEANDRDVPIAQVIEEMVEAFRNQKNEATG